jgi:hypothetical protein
VRRNALLREKAFCAAAIAVTHLPSIMKRLLFLLFVSFLTVSCKDETAFKVSEAGDNHEIIHVSFDDFKSNPEEYYGKYVKLEGMCVRVDKRGGSTMYMIGKDPSFEIKVAAGEDVIRFTRYFEGRVMEVLGYVRDEDPIHTLPKYYIESNQYRRIQKEGK